jgi:hypothetical protein
LQTWYTLDKNAVPPVYTLTNLSGDIQKDKEYWDHVLPTLVVALDGIPFDKRNADLLINRSISEYEAKYAKRLAGDKGEQDMLWIRREFKEEVKVTDPGYWDYKDTLRDNGGSKKAYIDQLHVWMSKEFSVKTIPIKNLESYRLLEPVEGRESAAMTSSPEQISGDDYVATWKKFASGKLNAALDKIIHERKGWDVDAQGLGIPGHEVTEMLRHSQWAARKVSDFVCREDELTYILDVAMAQSSGEHGTDAAIRDDHGIALSIIGESGVGKTALMAKVAAEIFRQQSSSSDASIRDRPVIIRFCGISGESSTGTKLIRSICRQIGVLMSTTGDDVLSMNRAALIQHFYSLLQKHPIVLMLDSLDQLDNTDLDRSNLAFLADLRKKDLHPLTRIIVSTLPDGRLFHFNR